MANKMGYEDHLFHNYEGYIKGFYQVKVFQLWILQNVYVDVKGFFST